ncbi:putative uncharacterized protein DDB_G0282133 [Microplitis mediator]|uniref:putative uncharacterized protein DDB_G0282133 n=1 Tax=Microplitis mediator TaxID=375433 RepID=UPI00255350BF|nr:putative uncharacterized protein DDB_G0282133 [Microplitis mediator]XP_057331696.1 putative uncharacterized protein DDB_G0282133 [Microplitis mediator]
MVGPIDKLTTDPTVKNTSDGNRISYPIDRRLVDKNKENGYTGENKNLKKKKSNVRRYNPYNKISETESRIDKSKDENNKVNKNLESYNPRNPLNKNSNLNDENKNIKEINKVISNENLKNNKRKPFENFESNKSIILPDYSDGSSSSGDIYDAAALRKRLIKNHPSYSSDDSYLTDFGLSYIANKSIKFPKHKKSRNLSASSQSSHSYVPETPKIIDPSLPLLTDVQTQITASTSNLKPQTNIENTEINKNKSVLSQIKRSHRLAEFTPSPAARTRRKIVTTNNKTKKIITLDTSDDESNTDETEIINSRIYSSNSNDIETDSPIETIPITPRTPTRNVTKSPIKLCPASIRSPIRKINNSKNMGGAIPWSSEEGGDHPKILNVEALVHADPYVESNAHVNMEIDKTTCNNSLTRPMDIQTSSDDNVIPPTIVNIDKNKTNVQKVEIKNNPKINNDEPRQQSPSKAIEKHRVVTNSQTINNVTNGEPQLRRSKRQRKPKTCSCCTDNDKHTHTQKHIPYKIQKLSENIKMKTKKPKNNKNNFLPQLPKIMVTLEAINRQQNANDKLSKNKLSVINENVQPINSQNSFPNGGQQNPAKHINSPVDQNLSSIERINSFNDQNFDQREQINSFNNENLDQIEQINSSNNITNFQQNLTELNSDSNQEQIDNVIIVENNNPDNEQIDSDDDSSVVSVMSNDFSNDNIIETRDNLEMQKNSYLCFFNTDGPIPSEIGKQLLLSGYLNLNPFAEYKVGQVIKMGTPKRKVLALVIQNNNTDVATEKDYCKAFKNLKLYMEKSKLKSISVSQRRSNLPKTVWPKIKNIIAKTFKGTDIKIIICRDQIIIPPVEERQKIMAENHETPMAGHKGVTKTYNRIRQRYFWDNIKKNVEDFVRKCISCQKKKLVRIKTKQPMVITDTSAEIWDKLALDIVVPNKTSANGYSYILTMQDDLSKYCFAIPLVSMTAKDIAIALVENFILKHGCPRVILTDQGQAFIGKVMNCLAKTFKMKQIKTTAFHPQSNGSLERSHQVLTDYIKHFTSKNDWDKWLPHATFAYNTSVHEGTKFTPYRLVFGKEARLPSEFSYLDDIPTYADYVKELATRLLESRKEARENLENSKSKSKVRYDKKINPVKFKIGQNIYLIKNQRDGKFDDNYLGPYKITEIFPDKNDIEIEYKPGKRKLIHCDRAKIAYK